MLPNLFYVSSAGNNTIKSTSCGGTKEMALNSQRVIANVNHWLSYSGSSQRQATDTCTLYQHTDNSCRSLSLRSCNLNDTQLKVRKAVKIMNRYNHGPHLTQDITWESDKSTIKHYIQEPRGQPFPSR